MNYEYEGLEFLGAPKENIPEKRGPESRKAGQRNAASEIVW